MQFRRTTHGPDCRPRSFSARAEKIWSTTPAGLVGHMMDERPVTLDALLARLRAYQGTYAEATEALTIADVLRGLASLLDLDMAATSAATPAATSAAAGVSADEHEAGLFFLVNGIDVTETELHPAAHAVLKAAHRTFGANLDPTFDRVFARLNAGRPEHARIGPAEALRMLASLQATGHLTCAERLRAVA